MRALHWIGLAVLPLDFVMSWAVGRVQPGYDPIAQFMSELAVPGQPLAGLMMAWWLVYGAALVGLGVAVGRRAGPLLIAVGATLGIGTGLSPCDPACAGATVSARVHELLGVIGCLAFVAGPIATWRAPPGATVSALLLLAIATLFAPQIAAGAGNEERELRLAC